MIYYSGNLVCLALVSSAWGPQEADRYLLDSWCCRHSSTCGLVHAALPGWCPVQLSGSHPEGAGRYLGEFRWFGLKVKQSVLDLRKCRLRNPSRAHKRGLETWPRVGLLMRLESFLILVFNQLINYFNMIFSFFLKRSFFLTVKCCQEYSRVLGNFLWNMPFAFIFMTSHPSPVWRNNRAERNIRENNQMQGQESKWDSGAPSSVHHFVNIHSRPSI